ncbi:PREDICTED: platelet-activating factor acetylhydrolase IB subunit beta homolog [Nicrophorus vespilloides]|uniref:Platelet-activating factor acetylhydrolase IB subunit beta homolog n=1 Tax=Nicrophorus vespilloides TaxID=110193 RepID=A0ABM1MEP8_NICVS|nr:PREDICTED: platelet-activating factor acetylhydrolase IB subunit beta homolog [Nicrophorus vespilloides]
MVKMHPCTKPLPVEDPDGDQRWMSIHNRFLSETREKDADVIFIGDSILQALQHTDIWNELFAPLHCLNFGIHRDLIQNVLWRIQNGELDNVRPKAVVLHVGTNNHQNTPEEIVDGITEIINSIKEKLPDVYIVVPSLLPRGQHPNVIRDKINLVNEILKSRLPIIPKVELIAIDKGFIQPDGTISHHDMHDYLLLTNAGSKKAFEPVHELLLQLLNEGEPEKDLTPSE